MTRKLLKIALVVLLSVVSISIDAQEKPVLWYDKPARYWEEALPLEMDDWEPWYMVIL